MSAWTLHIKELQGDSVDITVSNPSTATILDLKRLFHQCEHTVPPYEQRFVFERTELVDDRRLSAYPEIKHGSTIFLIRLIPFQLFIKGMDGTNYTLNIPTRTPERYSVAHLKKLVQDRTGIRPEEQRLQYGGKQLMDTGTLGDYNLTNNATLHLVGRLRGGLAYYARASYDPTMRMPCGHTMGKSAIYTHCMSEIKRNRSKVSCPDCSAEWSVKTLGQSSYLTPSQVQVIDEGLTRNFCLSMPGVTSCVECGGVWSCTGGRGSVCPSCSKKKKNDDQATLEVLANCESKTIGHAVCPAIRACPRCGKLINHIEACKRVDCDGCKTKFCFVCLTIRAPTLSDYYPCRDACPTAARQIFIPRN